MQKEKYPLFLGVFAVDPEGVAQLIRKICHDVLSDINGAQKTIVGKCKDHNQHNQKNVQKVKQSLELSQKRVQQDNDSFDKFKCPPFNYHTTCLYMGNASKQENNPIYKEWKNGKKVLLCIRFLVYVPNYLLAGYISKDSLQNQGIKTSNEFAHMTLLLRGDAQAVESNYVLKTLYECNSQIFEGRQSSRIVYYDIPYVRDKDRKTISQGIYGIVMSKNEFQAQGHTLQIEGVTGDVIK